MRRLATLMMVGVLSSTVAVFSAGPASAGVCSGSYTFNKVTNDSITFTRATGSNSSVTGDTGVTLKISKSTTFKVSGSIDGSAEVSVAKVVAAVKAKLGATIAASRTGKSSTSGAWTVPPNYKKGRLAIGSNKYKGTVTKYLENKACVNVKVGSSAKYNAPKNEWHFKTSKVA